MDSELRRDQTKSIGSEQEHGSQRPQLHSELRLAAKRGLAVVLARVGKAGRPLASPRSLRFLVCVCLYAFA